MAGIDDAAVLHEQAGDQRSIAAGEVGVHLCVLDGGEATAHAHVDVMVVDRRVEQPGAARDEHASRSGIATVDRHAAGRADLDERGPRQDADAGAAAGNRDGHALHLRTTTGVAGGYRHLTLDGANTTQDHSGRVQLHHSAGCYAAVVEDASDRQGAVVEVGRAGVGVAAGQGEVVCALLGQATTATEHARKGSIGPIAGGQGIGIERDERARDSCKVADGLTVLQVEGGPSPSGVDSTAIDEGLAADQAQGAGVDGGQARVGVEGVEGQRASATLGQGAATPVDRDADAARATIGYRQRLAVEIDWIGGNGECATGGDGRRAAVHREAAADGKVGPAQTQTADPAGVQQPAKGRSAGAGLLAHGACGDGSRGVDVAGVADGQTAQGSCAANSGVEVDRSARGQGQGLGAVDGVGEGDSAAAGIGYHGGSGQRHRPVGLESAGTGLDDSAQVDACPHGSSAAGARRVEGQAAGSTDRAFQTDGVGACYRGGEEILAGEGESAGGGELPGEGAVVIDPDAAGADSRGARAGGQGETIAAGAGGGEAGADDDVPLGTEAEGGSDAQVGGQDDIGIATPR